MNGDNVDLLVGAIDDERECCKSLIEASEAEQRSRVESDLDGIQASVAEMQRAVRELRQLQNLRERLMAAVAESVGDVDASTNVARRIEQLADGLPVAAAKRLRDSHRRLIKASNNLYRANQQTIYLIEFSLNLVDGQVAAWRNSLVERQGYDDGGRSRDRRSEARLFEDKA